MICSMAKLSANYIKEIYVAANLGIVILCYFLVKKYLIGLIVKKLPMLKCKNMDKDIIYLLSLLMMTQRQVFQLSQKTETFCG